jgi:hypothetical protein
VNEGVVDYRTSSSRRVKRPKTLEDYYTPFINGTDCKFSHSILCRAFDMMRNFCNFVIPKIMRKRMILSRKSAMMTTFLMA